MRVSIYTHLSWVYALFCFVFFLGEGCSGELFAKLEDHLRKITDKDRGPSNPKCRLHLHGQPETNGRKNSPSPTRFGHMALAVSVFGRQRVETHA